MSEEKGRGKLELKLLGSPAARKSGWTGYFGAGWPRTTLVAA
jgi:hypothetical protein